MVKFGLIGLGKWGKNYIKVLNTLDNFAEIKIICCRNLSTIIKLNEIPKGEYRNSASYKEVCSSEDVDAVIIATPPETHYEIVKFALKNNKHVLCEKPFVFDPDQAKELHYLAESKKLCLVIDYIHLWSDFYKKVKNFCKFEDYENVKFTVENPKTGREHHSVLWDWMTHDVAMMCHLSNSKTMPNYYNLVHNEKDILKSDTIAFDCALGYGSKCSIWLDINSKKKSRSIVATHKNGQVLQVWDTFDKNPLREVLVDFINAIDNKIVITNAPLAVDVTRILNDCYYL